MLGTNKADNERTRKIEKLGCIPRCQGIFLFPLPKLSLEGREMHDKNTENGAAKMAWQLFEKTGSINYYMLYYDLLRKK